MKINKRKTVIFLALTGSAVLFAGCVPNNVDPFQNNAYSQGRATVAYSVYDYPRYTQRPCYFYNSRYYYGGQYRDGAYYYRGNRLRGGEYYRSGYRYHHAKHVENSRILRDGDRRDYRRERYRREHSRRDYYKKDSHGKSHYRKSRYNDNSGGTQGHATSSDDYRSSGYMRNRDRNRQLLGR